MEIAAWLNALGLGQYAQAFADNHIEAGMLPRLTAEDLKELGVVSLGHRKRLLEAIAGLADAVGEAPIPPSQGPTAQEGERRQVTILFADLCGFTALSRSLDVEELHGVVDRFTATVDRIIEAYGGTIDKHIGDAVMALFGAPVAHGDDPLRAVRAALDIHAAMAELGAGLGRRLEAHVGIASGEVVAGGLTLGGQPEYTVLGDAVNLAARLQDIARPGDTLISDAVYRTLAGRVECESLGEVALKGLHQPVRVWRTRLIAGEGSLRQTPFVGRRAELAQFTGILEACWDTRCGHTILLRGEPGIGKTRLLEEMIRLAERHGFAVHRALVLDFGVGKGRDAIRALVRSLLGADPGADQALLAAAAERVLASGRLAPEYRVHLNDLLDLAQPPSLRGLYDAMDNDARNRGKREAVASLVRGAAANGPLLIAVEDIHWADPLTLASLARIASAATESPALQVITTRIEGDPVDQGWRGATGGSPLTTIELGPLRREDAMALAGGLIDTAKRSALACIERAGGNPLFLEQLLRHAEGGADEAIPASVQSLVLARMDRLATSDKQALQAASVIGQRFDLETLRYLLEVPGYACDALIQFGLVRPDGNEYLFAHALIQEGVYSSLLKARRRVLHLRAARWFAESDLILRAQHLDRAGDEGTSLAYREAAQAQMASYHSEKALELADRGLAIAKAGPDRHALMCLRGQLLHDLGKVADSTEAYRQALAAAEDDVARCHAWIGLASGMRISDKVDDALALLDQAQAAAESHQLIVDLSHIHYLRGNLYFPLGRIEGCRKEHELALECARRCGSVEAEARALSGIADAEYARGRMRSAFEHFSRCVELSRQHGFGRIEVANRSMIGFSRMYLNELDEALEDGGAAAALAAAVGHQRAELLGEIIATFALYVMVELERATQHLERARQLAGQLGAPRFEAQNLEFEARIRRLQGRIAEARRLAQEARAMSRERGLNFIAPRIMVLIAQLAEDPAEMRRALEEGEALLRAGAVGHNHLWFYTDAMEAELAVRDWDRVERYAAALEDYTRAQPLPWSDFFIARGRALASVGRGRRDAATRRELERLRDEARRSKLRLALPALDATLAELTH